MVKFVGLGLASLTLKARAEPAPAPETGMDPGVFQQLIGPGHDSESSLINPSGFPFAGNPVGLTPLMPVMNFASARPAKFQANQRFQDSYTPYVAPSFGSNPEPKSNFNPHSQAESSIRPQMNGASHGAPPMMGAPPS